jgi:hypothetical protein
LGNAVEIAFFGVVGLIIVLALAFLFRSRGESYMKKSVLEVYGLLVCSVCIVFMGSAVATAIYDMVRLVSPEITISSMKYRDHQTNDAYWASIVNYIQEDKAEPKKPSEAELTKKRVESYKLELKTQKHMATGSLIVSFITLLIYGIIFIVHWKIAKHARNKAALVSDRVVN